jgi:UMF1 family MFS transporter
LVGGPVPPPGPRSSRRSLPRPAPQEKITQFFGLFAFSGKVTAFLAPFLVASLTAATGSQRFGMSAIALFLIAGMVLMLRVRSPAPRP